jgi:Leucine Rich Repeat (LRR) protein
MSNILCFSLDTDMIPLCDKFYDAEEDENLHQEGFLFKNDCYNPVFFVNIKEGIKKYKPVVVVIFTHGDLDSGTYFHSKFLLSNMPALNYHLIIRDNFYNTQNDKTLRMSLYGLQTFHIENIEFKNVKNKIRCREQQGHSPKALVLNVATDMGNMEFIGVHIPNTYTDIDNCIKGITKELSGLKSDFTFYIGNFADYIVSDYSSCENKEDNDVYFHDNIFYKTFNKNFKIKCENISVFKSFKTLQHGDHLGIIGVYNINGEENRLQDKTKFQGEIPMDIYKLIMKEQSGADMIRTCESSKTLLKKCEEDQTLWKNLYEKEYGTTTMIKYLDQLGSYYALYKLCKQISTILDKFKAPNESLDEVYFNTPSINVTNSTITVIPPEIGVLKNLFRLRVYKTQVTIIPKEIGKLELLKIIDLSYNKIINIPREIGNLTSLRELKLSDNQITYIPKEIGQLFSLEILELQRNKIKIVPKELGNLKLLKILDLASNNITIVPKELGNLNNLTLFSLRFNDIDVTKLSDEIIALRGILSL